MSTFVLIMRTSQIKTNTISALFNQTKQAILTLMFSNVDEAYHLREVARRSGISVGILSRELKLLYKAEILLKEARGNQVFYSANKQCPIYNELHSIIIKSVGLADMFREALLSLKDRISTAFIYGSFARGEENAESDIDLMVIGDARLLEVVKALGAIRATYEREINPSVFQWNEYHNKLAHGDHFLTSLKGEPKIFLIGNEDEFRKLG